MKKRIWSAVLMLCMLASLFPAGVSAADTINIVRLTIEEPAVGKTPSAAATLPFTASTYVKSVNWTGELDSNGKFQSEKVYTVTVALGIKEGLNRTFKTTKASLLTINGKQATLISETAEELVLSYKFTIAANGLVSSAEGQAGDSKVIRSLSITGLTEPKQGDMPDKSVTVSQKAAFGTIEVSWNSTGWNDTKPFDGLLAYTVQIHLVLNKGYSFDPAIFDEGSVTINGKTATARKGFNDAYIDIFYTFPKLDLYIESNITRIVIGGVVGPAVNRKMETPTVDSYLYKLDSYEWSDGPDRYGNYKDDTKYTLTMTLTPHMNSRFSKKALDTVGKSNPRITSAGGYGSPIVSSFSETKLVLKWSFPRTTAYKGEKPATMVDSPFAFAGGSGTYEDPYLIETAHQLNAVRMGMDKHYRLTADIDLSSWGNWIPIGSNEAYGGVRSGGANHAYKNTATFTGSLDGGGHVISGMTIKIDAGEVYMAERLNVRYYGLFMNLDAANGTQIVHSKGSRTNDPYTSEVRAGVRNLGMINFNIDIHHSVIKDDYEIYAGPISGSCHGVGMYNCYSAGGTIRLDLRDAGDVKQLVRVGGLVGNSSWTDFRGCYNASDITVLAKSETGDRKELEGAGISGTSIASWYMSCFNKGNITMPQYQDPIKAGTQLAAGTACGITTFAWAPVFPLLYHTGEANNNYIWNCYNAGTLTGEFVGGIMLYGNSDYYVDNCYNAGVLNGSKTEDVNRSVATEYPVCVTWGDIEPFGTEYIRRIYSDGSSISGDQWQFSDKLGRKVLRVNPEESLTVPVVKPAEPIVGNFTDVKADAWYAEAVKWAVEKGITTGTSETTFSPSDTCTRAQILTFLWRAVGSPKSGAANPFTDVKADDYYYDAAVWASEKGMATGSLFEGNTPCTRASTVIYLWQNAGSPDTAVSGEFADVPADAAYAKAVSWAVRNGVTSGTSETTFSPDDTCTRGQIVTFLNRALK